MVFLLSLEYPSLGGFNISFFYRIVVCLCTVYIERVRFDADCRFENCDLYDVLDAGMMFMTGNLF